jgi:hypothetical protein
MNLIVDIIILLVLGCLGIFWNHDIWLNIIVKYGLIILTILKLILLV